MRIPQTLTLSEMQAAFRDIYAKIEPQLVKNIDLHGRRVGGAGKAVDQFDYVTRYDVEKLIEALQVAGTAVKSETALSVITSVRIGAFAVRGAAAAHPNSMFAASDRDYISWVSDGANWSYHAGVHRDTLANRPTPAATDTNYRYFATDTFEHFYWTGAAWVKDIAPAFLPFLSAAATHGALKRDGAGLVLRVGDDSADSFLKVLDEAYGAGWDGKTEVPTKNAVYDKLESLPTLAHGTYTPTLTNSANLDASTAYLCQYMRVGNVVTVSGRFNANPTLAATYTQLNMSLPIASNFSAGGQCGGCAVDGYPNTDKASINADTGADNAVIVWVSAGTANGAMFFTFTYLIV